MHVEKPSFLSEDELHLLVNAPKEFAPKGAARTGKTWLLREKIRNVAAAWFSDGPIESRDEKIPFVCRSPGLAVHPEETLLDLLLESATAALAK